MLIHNNFFMEEYILPTEAEADVDDIVSDDEDYEIDPEEELDDIENDEAEEPLFDYSDASEEEDEDDYVEYEFEDEDDSDSDEEFHNQEVSNDPTVEDYDEDDDEDIEYREEF